jgi:type II secretory pathway component PulF
MTRIKKLFPAIADIGGLEPVLAHLLARAKNNLPLIDAAEEQAPRNSQLAENAFYLAVRRGLSQGQTLSRALASCEYVPPAFLSIIEQGEREGDLAGALASLLKRFPAVSRFRNHVRAVVLYTGLLLATFSAVVLLHLWLYSDMVRSVAASIPVTNEGIFSPLSMMTPGSLLFLIVALIVGVSVVIRLNYHEGLLRFLMKRLPIVRDNYFRILSLQIAEAVLFGLTRGADLGKAVADAAAGADDPVIKQAFLQAVGTAGKGEGAVNVLSRQEALRGLPVSTVIGIAAESGNPKDFFKEHVDQLQAYLDRNLDREMRLFMNLCHSACGLVIGTGIVYLWISVWHAYTFLSQGL